MGKKVVCIGMPLGLLYLHIDAFMSFVMMEKQGAAWLSHMKIANSGPVHEMRNRLVVEALHMDATHLFFLDSDMCIPGDTIPRLLAHNKEIVGGLCFKRWPDFEPTLYQGDQYKLTIQEDYNDGLLKVTATGAACLLVDMIVFEQMQPPWFTFGETPDGGMVGEDIGFCYRAGDLGFDVYVDTTVKTGHLSTTQITQEHFRLNRELKQKGLGQFHF